jgi:hypothetical protein
MNRTARSILALGVLLAGLWLSPFGLQNAAGAPSGPNGLARVGFSQDVYNVTVGDDFSIGITVADADALGGWEATLVFAPGVVQPTELSAGAFLTTSGREAALLGPSGEGGGGQIALGGYSWGTEDGVSGEGEIAHVGLHAFAVGESVLNLTDPLLASVHGASVRGQEVEVHTAQVNVYAAPSAPAATIAQDGASARITWQHITANTSYQVWRSAFPYFTPGEGDSITPIASGLPPAPNCTMVGDTITCSDPGVLATPGRYFYLVQGLNPAGAKATSAQMGAFVLPLTPGN